VQNLEKIELPNQLVAVLADPLLQKLMVLRPNDEASSRVNNWTASCVLDVHNGDAGAESLLDMIQVLQDYVSNTQVVSLTQISSPETNIRATDTATGFTLCIQRTVWGLGWCGQKGYRLGRAFSYSADEIQPWVKPPSSSSIFVLIDQSKELYETTFQPLEACLLDNTAESQLRLLGFYTALLRRWRIILLSAEDISSLEVSPVSDLVDHVNRLSLTLSQTASTVSTHLSILEFYECTSSLTTVPSLLRRLPIAIPPPTLVYILHFSHSPATLSRVCSIVATYKRGLEMAMKQLANRQLSSAENAHIKTFNGLLMDICNCIWRSKAFGRSDENSMGCCIPASVVASLRTYLAGVDPDTPLSSAFSISHSPALCLQSLSYVRDLEDMILADMEGELRERHGGPVTQKSLAVLKNRGGLDLSWLEYKSGVLRYLEQQAFVGVPELMYNTMKNLINSQS